MLIGTGAFREYLCVNALPADLRARPGDQGRPKGLSFLVGIARGDQWVNGCPWSNPHPNSTLTLAPSSGIVLREHLQRLSHHGVPQGKHFPPGIDHRQFFKTQYLNSCFH